MQLFSARIVNAQGVFRTHITAPEIGQASGFVKDYHREAGIMLTLIDVERIDQRMPEGRKRGLDALLDDAPTGFAAYDETAGWFMHSTLNQRMRLITIEPELGDPVFVVAPNISVASAFWLVSSIDDDGQHPAWSYKLDTQHLSEAQRSALPAFLEFAPPGAVIWNEQSGWSPKN